jgi:hypothetical protein
MAGCAVVHYTELADDIVCFTINPRDVSNECRENFTTIFLPWRTDTGETESDYVE